MKIGVVGAGGRMGHAVLTVVHESDEATLTAAVDRPGAPEVGADTGRLAGGGATGVLVTDTVDDLGGCDCVIDFTTPAASTALAKRLAEMGVCLVVGTTGFSADENADIAEAAATVPIVKSGNMSMGVNLLAAMVARAASALPDADIEIVEMHHRRKVDAPSGTALLLGEAAAKGREVILDDAAVKVREGHTGARPKGTIGFATLRGGTVIGEHQVIFASDSERVTLGHIAEDRTVFARGAVRAALWLKDRQPGLYSMSDVLGIAEI
ncbi:MAG: 4-hydroxy-tetrahydrodipicolinate reductase [Devosia sp.]